MKKLFLLLIPILALNSCTNTSNSNSASLNGKWNFVKVICYCEPLNRKPNGEITWAFNSKNRTISVVNNNTNQELVTPLKTGIYPYVFRVENGTNQISFDNGGYIYYKITDGILAIGDSSYDMPSFIFTR